MPGVDYQLKNLLPQGLQDWFLEVYRDEIEAAFQEALDFMVELITKHFDNNPSGWKPLTPETIRERLRLGYGAAPILYRTGHLKGEVAQSPTTMEMTGDRIQGKIYYPDDPVVEIQDKARPIYQLDDRELEQVQEKFQEALYKRLGI